MDLSTLYGRPICQVVKNTLELNAIQSQASKVPMVILIFVGKKSYHISHDLQSNRFLFPRISRIFCTFSISEECQILYYFSLYLTFTFTFWIDQEFKQSIRNKSEKISMIVYRVVLDAAYQSQDNVRTTQGSRKISCLEMAAFIRALCMLGGMAVI